MKAAKRKKRPLPDWYLDEPVLIHGEQFFINAFWLLNTERNVGMDLGEIPWSKIVKYGRHCQLDRDMIDILVYVVRELDGAYLGWEKKQAEKRARQSANQQSSNTQVKE